MSQAFAIKQEPAGKANVKVGNSLDLAPHRTFLEVEQPFSQFVFCMKDGSRDAIF